MNPDNFSQSRVFYNGVIRGKHPVVPVSRCKAIAVRNQGGRRRWSKLRDWLAGIGPGALIAAPVDHDRARRYEHGSPNFQLRLQGCRPGLEISDSI